MDVFTQLLHSRALPSILTASLTVSITVSLYVSKVFFRVCPWRSFYSFVSIRSVRYTLLGYPLMLIGLHLSFTDYYLLFVLSLSSTNRILLLFLSFSFITFPTYLSLLRAFSLSFLSLSLSLSLA